MLIDVAAVEQLLLGSTSDSNNFCTVNNILLNLEVTNKVLDLAIRNHVVLHHTKDSVAYTIHSLFNELCTILLTHFHYDCYVETNILLMSVDLLL